MEHQLCLLCKQREATKTNSHIIPSFMIAKVCSYDGSGKRDKEVMFTTTSYEDKVYTGQIPSTKYDELFDTEKLTDDRIEKELRDNTASKDYIFCPECEKDLSTFLESPYSDMLRTGKTDGIISYFFWLSVVWRMSISQQFNFRFPAALEENLGEILHSYIEKTKKNEDINDLITSCMFRYRLIYSPDFLSDEHNAGFFGGRYDYKRSILSLSMGDKILCVTFCEDPLPEDYKFIGAETELHTTPINNGQTNERITIVSKERFAEIVHQMVVETAFKRLNNEKELADAVWQKVGLPGGGMPDVIFKEFMQRLYSEESKQGDRKTNERYVQLFNETLQYFGFKPRN